MKGRHEERKTPDDDQHGETDQLLIHVERDDSDQYHKETVPEHEQTNAYPCATDPYHGERENLDLYHRKEIGEMM